MREIILDTETTGLNPQGGDRLIEIGCIELINRIPSGREFHCFINPERDVPAEAQAVHGLSTDRSKSSVTRRHARTRDFANAQLRRHQVALADTKRKPWVRLGDKRSRVQISAARPLIALVDRHGRRAMGRR